MAKNDRHIGEDTLNQDTLRDTSFPAVDTKEPSVLIAEQEREAIQTEPCPDGSCGIDDTGWQTFGAEGANRQWNPRNTQQGAGGGGQNNGGNHFGQVNHTPVVQDGFSLSALDIPIEATTHFERKGVRYAVYKTTRNTGYDKSMRFTRDNAMPLAQIGLNSLRSATAHVLAVNVGNRKAFQGAVHYFQQTYGNHVFSHIDFNHMSPKDLQRLQKEFTKQLKKHHKHTYWSKDPYIFSRQVKKAILSGVLKGDEAKMARVMAKQFREVNGLRNRVTSFKVIKRFAFRKALRSMTNDEGIEKAIIAVRVSKSAKRILKRAIRLKLMAGKKAIFAAKQARIAFLKTKVGQQALALKKLLLAKARNTRNKLFPKRRKRRPKKKPKPKKKGNPFKRAWAKLPHPFRTINRRIVLTRTRVIAFITRGKYNPLRIIGVALGKVLSAIGAALSVIKWLLAMIIVFYILFVIILVLISGGAFGYGYDQNDEATQSKYYKKIEELYEAQMAMIQNYAGEYQSITVKYEEKKDSEVYSDALDFKETTNAAEMLSMAQVYFDFDLDDAEESKVNEYLTGLYNGSHTISIEESATYTTDGEEMVLEQNKATITVTTYYFDELFDVSLTAASAFGGDSAIAGESWDIPQNFKQTITYEGRMSWVPTVAKSASNPMRKMYQAWVANGKNGGTAADGMNGIPCIIVNGQKRYLAAVVGHWGAIGDYVDVYLEDGSILPLILIDTKGCSDGQGYHNKNTCFIYQGVHYGHTANQHGDQTNCSVLEFMKMDNAPSGNPQSFCTRLKPVAGSSSNSIKVTKVVNGGSYLKNPSGPTYVNGDNTASLNGSNATATEFIQKLDAYSAFLKENANYINRSNSPASTYTKAKNRVSDGKSVGVNCVTPLMWALKSMGLIPKSTSFYGKKSSFHGYTNTAKAKLSRVTGSVNGMNVVSAAKKGLLQTGDIISVSNFNHTFVYAGLTSDGSNVLVYEAGGNAKNQGYAKVGCGPFSANQYKSLKIAAILRWK